jgi:hypothetical protein
MLDIKKLAKPGKGTPPAPADAAANNNLGKPASGLKVHQQVKISPETRRAFRARAAEMDSDLGTLFEIMWQFYKSNHG